MTNSLQVLFAAFAHVIYSIYRHLVTMAVAHYPRPFT